MYVIDCNIIYVLYHKQPPILYFEETIGPVGYPGYDFRRILLRIWHACDVQFVCDDDGRF